MSTPTADYLAHFHYRVLQDAYLEACADYWRRRATDLLAARPTASDFIPAGGLEAARARWRELTEAAKACINKASLLERDDTAIRADLRAELDAAA